MSEDEAARLPKGRIARTARVGGLVTGQGLRWAGMHTANRVRSPERAAEARDAYGHALALVHDEAERRLLERRLAQLDAAPS